VFMRPLSPADCQPAQVALVNYRRASLNKDAARMPGILGRRAIGTGNAAVPPNYETTARYHRHRDALVTVSPLRSRTPCTYAVRFPDPVRDTAVKYRVNRTSLYEIIILIHRARLIKN
jgi:hypothetical protein